jgi:hypothetical protein
MIFNPFPQFFAYSTENILLLELRLNSDIRPKSRFGFFVIVSLRGFSLFSIRRAARHGREIRLSFAPA